MAGGELACPGLSRSALPSMKGSSKRKLDQRVFLEQVHECRDKGYLLSSKIGSGAFSKVYLAYTTHERIMHNCKLASDLQGKCHTMVSRPASSRRQRRQEPCPNRTQSQLP